MSQNPYGVPQDPASAPQVGGADAHDAAPLPGAPSAPGSAPQPGAPSAQGSASWAGAPSAPGSTAWADGPAVPAQAARPAPRRLTLAMVILAVTLILVHLTSVAFGFFGAATVASSAGGGLFVILGLILLAITAAAFLVQLALLVLSIIVVVQGRGRVRTGGIIVIVALVLNVGRWLAFAIARAALQTSTDDYSSLAPSQGIIAIVEFAVALLLAAVMVVGAVIAWREARRPASSSGQDAPPVTAPLRPLG